MANFVCAFLDTPRAFSAAFSTTLLVRRGVLDGVAEAAFFPVVTLTGSGG